MTTVTRTQVVQAAREWVDTPFHHQARLKGVGVDCVGLVIGISRELGLCEPNFDVAAYPRTPDGRSLMRQADGLMTRVQAGSDLRCGQVLVVALGGEPQHMGILGDYRHGGLSLIHAAAVSRPARVIETRLVFGHRMKFVAAFELPGVVDDDSESSLSWNCCAWPGVTR